MQSFWPKNLQGSNSNKNKSNNNKNNKKSAKTARGRGNKIYKNKLFLLLGQLFVVAVTNAVVWLLRL